MTPMEIMLPLLAVNAIAAIHTLNNNAPARQMAGAEVRNGYLEYLSTSIRQDDGMSNSGPSIPQDRGPRQR